MLIPFIVQELEGDMGTVYPLLDSFSRGVGDGSVSKGDAKMLLPSLKRAVESLSSQLSVAEPPLEEKDFAWVYRDLKEFVDENWEEIVGGLNVMELLRFIPRARQESFRLQKTMEALRAQDSPLDDALVCQHIEHHLLFYELVADILLGFASSVNRRENIITIETDYVTKGQVYLVLRGFNNGKYKGLFGIFNRRMRNAGSHPGLRSGKVVTPDGVVFEDLGGKEFFTGRSSRIRRSCLTSLVMQRCSLWVRKEGNGCKG